MTPYERIINDDEFLKEKFKNSRELLKFYNKNKESEKFFGFANVFIMVVAIFTVCQIVAGLFGIGIDSTDKELTFGYKRSGMSLHVDNYTGCHYLSREGLYPRLDSNGNHICLEEPHE